jgi:hypothetical protein
MAVVKRSRLGTGKSALRLEWRHRRGKAMPAQSALNEIDVDGAGHCMDVAELNAANWHVKPRTQRKKLQARVTDAPTGDRTVRCSGQLVELRGRCRNTIVFEGQGGERSSSDLRPNTRLSRATHYPSMDVLDSGESTVNLHCVSRKWWYYGGHKLVMQL